VQHDVDVLQGMPLGAQMVIEGEADESPDWETGDLVLIIREMGSMGECHFTHISSSVRFPAKKFSLGQRFMIDIYYWVMTKSRSLPKLPLPQEPYGIPHSAPQLHAYTLHPVRCAILIAPPKRSNQKGSALQGSYQPSGAPF
jgi:hypothetical protein